MNELLSSVIDNCHAHHGDLVYQYLHSPFIHHRILTDYMSIIEKLLHQRLALLPAKPALATYALRVSRSSSGTAVFSFSAPHYDSIRNLTYSLKVRMKRSFAFPSTPYAERGMLVVEEGAIRVDNHAVLLQSDDIESINFTFSDPTTVVSPGPDTFVFYTSHLYGMYIVLPNSTRFYVDCLRCFPHQESSRLFTVFRDPANADALVSDLLRQHKLEFDFDAFIFSDLVYYLDKRRQGPPLLNASGMSVPVVNPLQYRNIDELFSHDEQLADRFKPKASIQHPDARAFVSAMLDKFLPFVQFCRFDNSNRMVSVSTRRFDFSQQSNYNTLMYFASCPYHGMFVIRERAKNVGFFFVYEYRCRAGARPLLIDFRFMSEKLYILHHFTFFASSAFAELPQEARVELARLAGAGLNVGDDYVPFRDLYEPSAAMDSVINSNDEYSLINFLKLVDGIDGWITHDRAIDLTEIFCMNAWEMMEPVGAALFDVRPVVDSEFALVPSVLETGAPAASAPEIQAAWKLLLNAIGTNPMWLKCGGFGSTLLTHPLKESTRLMARFDYDRFYNVRPTIYRVFNMRRWLAMLSSWIWMRLETGQNNKVVYVPSSATNIQFITIFMADYQLEAVIMFVLDETNVALASELSALTEAGGVATGDFDAYVGALLDNFATLNSLTLSFYKMKD